MEVENSLSALQNILRHVTYVQCDETFAIKTDLMVRKELFKYSLFLLNFLTGIVYIRGVISTERYSASCAGQIVWGGSGLDSCG